ncbi:zinc ribbon domain-containing protein [Halorubrum distributum]|uniref:Uncharacterized protein n=1 Tax=Halorubrum distributum JCM 13916 TaxID=1230455 RepID=M0PSC3_9EURY|nr:zinc ribbon domain-containing protein [Halorubrum arcis]EMA71745.1 hypothetical protein C462_05278 [Halorubrum arcis JCM 13916]
MKLTTRRTVRQWFLDAPRGAFYGLLALMAGLIVVGAVTETDWSVLSGIVGLIAVFYFHGESEMDACPTCRAAVNATSERYCPTCGARLDDLEAAPPIDERVDERFRPVGLEHLEREPEPDKQPAAMADGGDRKNDKEER